MDPNEFEQRMRALEYFHSLRVLPGAWTVIRVDGRSFSRFTETGFEKPFDDRFHGYMVNTASALLEELHGLYAYTESDEISILFPPQWNMFDREVEKLVSISAGIASATFTHQAGVPVTFDSRIWVGVNQELVIDYFRWRQADAARCALNGWVYWTLRNGGQTVAEATATMHQMTPAQKNETLFQHGVNFNDLPLWQRRGAAAYYEFVEKTGYDPHHQVARAYQRRKLKVNEELPMKEQYAAFLQSLLTIAEAKDE
ncbi:MAG TPA: tRNA(His) guanylyltransferase Thg1 family protein [Ktedonobacterales bacterium]|jgi:tRNA(His) guanylyltransferase|nr:tRNA(His) guanylyltransferase Thg1 family protein [Ktedonobacterales bacterium]